MAKRAFLIFQAAVIAAATWFVYAPAFHGGWFWDDPSEITGNAALHSRAGLWKIWFSPDSPDYYPLKTTLQWVQWHLWGDHVTGYHLTNVGLHLLSAFLLWHLLRQLGVRLAWLGGLIFAIHPLAVESVAWISELKNVLSLPFLLPAMIFWIEFDQRKQRQLAAESAKSAEKSNTLSSLRSLRSLRLTVLNWYGLSLTCFVAAMLCKSSVVMFPFVLLLYGWWRRGRVTRKDLLASVPFFAVALALGLVTFWFQENIAIKGIVVQQGGFWSRLAVAGMAIVFYLWKFIWPINLLPIYPRWAADPPSVWQFWPWVAVAIAAVFICRWSGLSPTRFLAPGGEDAPNADEARSGQHAPPSIARHVLFGLGWFLVNLIPVLGFVPMSFLRISWVADHFAYLPMVGLVGLAAAGIGEVLKVAQASRLPSLEMQARTPALPSENRGVQIRFIWLFLLAVIIAALAFEGRQHAAIFQSEQAAWTYTLARNPQAWLAHNNLGNILLNEGRITEAKEQIEDALRLKPDFAEAHNNLGNILLQMGRPEEAKPHFEAAIKFRENYAEAYNGLGNYFLRIGRPDKARELYEEALRIKPDYPDCGDNLGAALENLGRTREAIIQYEKVLQAKPDLATAHYNLGITLTRVGRFSDAIAHYQEALRLDPTLLQGYNNLGNTLVAMKRTAEAIAVYEQALKLNPDFFEIHLNLGNALFNTHRVPEAVVQFEEALRLQPNYAPGHNNLGIALQAMGRMSEARAQFEKALRLDPGDAEALKNLDRVRSLR